MVAANAPDIDVLTSLRGSTVYLHYHRGITHGLVMIPLIALLPVALVRLVSGRPLEWKKAWLVSMAGVASHPLLDWTNIYGVRLLLPFSGSWLRLDLLSVVDPWIWAVLLLAALVPAVLGLVNAEIGARAKSGLGRGLAFFALGFLLLYNCGRAVLHQRALSVLDSRIYDGAPARRVAAFPDAVNPLRWRGLVETDASSRIFALHLGSPFDPTAGDVFYPAAPSPEIEVARESEAFRVFTAYAQYPLFTITSLADGSVRVQLVDLRFGTPRAPGFVATATVGPGRRLIESDFRFLGRRPK